MLANGDTVKGVDVESKFGMMDRSMRDIGVMTWQMAEEGLFMQMEMFLKDLG